jgi:hypothetical protein
MATSPANPCPRTVLAAELAALDEDLWAVEGEIGGDRLETAGLIVQAARELVGRAAEPVDRDVLALARVTVACLRDSEQAGLDVGDVAAALTLIAKTASAEGAPPRGGDDRAHVRATLAVIAAPGAVETRPRDSSRSADAAAADHA